MFPYPPTSETSEQRPSDHTLLSMDFHADKGLCASTIKLYDSEGFGQCVREEKIL